jgi:protein TonB
MFDGFTAAPTRAARRLALSAGASIGVYLLVGAGLLAVAGATAAPVAKKRVEVVFRPPPPPPPPAPEAAPPPPPPPRPAAPPPRTLATRQVANLPPPAPLVAPTEVPLEKPLEGEPTGEAIVVAAASASSGGYGEWVSAQAPSPASAPIHLPEHATPPVPSSTNRQPEFPQEARERGLSGVVVLRIVIDARGAVTKLEALRGEEPFVTAAVSAVRTWRYEPAKLDGAPVAHFRIVRVPFRLETR